MKKTITSLLFVALIITSTTSTVFATSKDSTASSHSKCPVESCRIIKTHQHDRMTYFDNNSKDGYTYHTINNQHNRHNKNVNHH